MRDQLFFFPTFFMQVRGYTAAEAASLVGLSNGIAVFGYLAAAIVGEYWLTRRNVFILWTLSGAVALLALLFLPRTRLEDIVCFSLMAGLFYGAMAVLPVLVAEIFPRRIRATATAVAVAAPNSLGFALFPFVVPWTVERLGWQMALAVIVLPALLAASAIALMLPDRRSGEPMT